eukprot:scaffold99154_cov47-Prasinocladus_malaysianus.AAC.2
MPASANFNRKDKKRLCDLIAVNEHVCGWAGHLMAARAHHINELVLWDILLVGPTTPTNFLEDTELLVLQMT